MSGNEGSTPEADEECWRVSFTKNYVNLIRLIESYTDLNFDKLDQYKSDTDRYIASCVATVADVATNKLQRVVQNSVDPDDQDGPIEQRRKLAVKTFGYIECLSKTLKVVFSMGEPPEEQRGNQGNDSVTQFGEGGHEETGGTRIVNVEEDFLQDNGVFNESQEDEQGSVLGGNEEEIKEKILSELGGGVDAENAGEEVAYARKNEEVDYNGYWDMKNVSIFDKGWYEGYDEQAFVAEATDECPGDYEDEEHVSPATKEEEMRIAQLCCRPQAPTIHEETVLQSLEQLNDYDVSSNQPFTEWFDRFENCLNIAERDMREPRKVELFGRKLQGTALQHFQQMRPHLKVDIATVSRAIGKLVERDRAAQQLFEQLPEMEAGSEVAGYVGAFQEAVSSCSDKRVLVHEESKLLDSFINGLSYDYSTYVINKGPTTLSEAMNLAVKLETMMRVEAPDFPLSRREHNEHLGCTSGWNHVDPPAKPASVNAPPEPEPEPEQVPVQLQQSWFEEFKKDTAFRNKWRHRDNFGYVIPSRAETRAFRRRLYGISPPRSSASRIVPLPVPKIRLQRGTKQDYQVVAVDKKGAVRGSASKRQKPRKRQTKTRNSGAIPQKRARKSDGLSHFEDNYPFSTDGTVSGEKNSG